MNRKRKIRLAALTLHPIHYQAALWRRLAQEPGLDLTVYFCSREGMETADPVEGYGQPVEWGVPLLSGYRHVFLWDWKLTKNASSFWCRMNPGIIPALWRGGYDALFVHSYHNFTQLAAIVAAHRLGLKVLVRSEPTLLINTGSPRRKIKQVLLPWLFGQVDAFMSIGSLNREYYHGYGVGDKKIFLMPYAVDNEFFWRQRDFWKPQRQQIKEEYQIRQEKVILYVGRFLPRKRVFGLIRAYELLSRPDTALVLVGEGGELAACRQYVAERGIAGVHFMGFRNQAELPKIYAMSDVFVLPSEDEPWGLVINEAMCFGLPIVAADQVGAAADLVQPGRNGYTFPAGDVGELARVLTLILTGEAGKRMGEASAGIIRRWGLDEDAAAIRQALAGMGNER
jgi:glycosyltransferase involved in cell wall biosynthesis